MKKSKQNFHKKFPVLDKSNKVNSILVSVLEGAEVI